MDIIFNAAAWFQNLSPIIHVLVFVGGGTSLGAGIMYNVHQHKMKKVRKTLDKISTYSKGNMELIKELEKHLEQESTKRSERNTELIEGLKQVSDKSTNTHEQVKLYIASVDNQRTANKKANIDFCRNLLEKNYIRYKKDPTSIDLTLEALDNCKLVAMQSLVANQPDQVYRNIDARVKAARVARHIPLSCSL